MALNLEKGLLLSCTLLANRHRLNGFVRIFFLCSRLYDYIFHPFRLHLHFCMLPRAVEIPYISHCIEVALHTTNFTLHLRQGYIYITFILLFQRNSKGFLSCWYESLYSDQKLLRNILLRRCFSLAKRLPHICFYFRYLALIGKEKQ